MGTTAQPSPTSKDQQGCAGSVPSDPLTGLTAKPASVERLMAGTIRPQAARTQPRSANPGRLGPWLVGILVGGIVTFLTFWFW
jgi:hypothetical protein